jgi:hypothetical protein
MVLRDLTTTISVKNATIVATFKVQRKLNKYTKKWYSLFSEVFLSLDIVLKLTHIETENAYFDVARLQ